MSAPLVGWIAALTLVLLAGFLAALETVLQRLSLARALRLAEEGTPRADRLVWLLERRASALNVVLVATVSVRAVTAALVAGLVVAATGAALAVAGAVAVLVVATLLVGEVAPRTLALRHLEATGLRVAAPGRLVVGALRPVAASVVAAGRMLVRTRGEVSGPFPSDEELRELLDAEDEDEELEEDELAMIHSIFALSDTIVREIMVPRPDMVMVDDDATRDQVVEVILDRGYSRIPVRRSGSDEIVGMVYAKDVLKRLAREPGIERWHDLMRPPTIVPETKPIDELLRALQEQAVHLAVVVDEYGALVGLVTIEDIVEEIVGEIVDEHDQEEPLVETLDDDSLRVDARLPVGDLNDLLGASLPTDGWDTVGGMVFGTLGHVPSPGESLEIEGLTLVAERVQGRRVAKVLVRRREPAAAQEGAET